MAVRTEVIPMLAEGRVEKSGSHPTLHSHCVESIQRATKIKMKAGAPGLDCETGEIAKPPLTHN